MENKLFFLQLVLPLWTMLVRCGFVQSCQCGLYGRLERGWKRNLLENCQNSLQEKLSISLSYPWSQSPQSPPPPSCVQYLSKDDHKKENLVAPTDQTDQLIKSRP